MMKRAWELDKEFHFGGPDLFFGVYYASRPAMLGGDPAKAKTHFEWARRLTAGKYLMAYVLEARYYAVAVQDRELFTALLTRVKDSPAGALPDARLSAELLRDPKASSSSRCTPAARWATRKTWSRRSASASCTRPASPG